MDTDISRKRSESYKRELRSLAQKWAWQDGDSAAIVSAFGEVAATATLVFYGEELTLRMLDELKVSVKKACMSGHV